MRASASAPMVAPMTKRTQEGKYLTTAEAAASVGLTTAGFRGAMTRARNNGVDVRAPSHLWPDQRTPLWDATMLEQWRRMHPREVPAR